LCWERERARARREREKRERERERERARDRDRDRDRERETERERERESEERGERREKERERERDGPAKQLVCGGVWRVRDQRGAIRCQRRSHVALRLPRHTQVHLQHTRVLSDVSTGRLLHCPALPSSVTSPSSAEVKSRDPLLKFRNSDLIEISSS
jgi:hypothetical protein